MTRYAIAVRDQVADWKPHASYHASGQHHHKSSGHKMAIRFDQKPDGNLVGRAEVASLGIAADEPKALNTICKPEDYAGVFEIPVQELSAEKYRTIITVDLVEPSQATPSKPNVLRYEVFQDTLPWILVTLTDTQPSVTK